MLQWLAEHAASFRIEHNAHREHGGRREIAITVQDYLRHRQRSGYAFEMSADDAMATCMRCDELWEVQACLHDGREFSIAGPSFDACLDQIEAKMRRLEPLLAA